MSRRRMMAITGVGAGVTVAASLPGCVDDPRRTPVGAAYGALPSSCDPTNVCEFVDILMQGSVAELRRYGYVGDGGSHTLASVEPSWSLQDWQTVFPAESLTGSDGALSLTDEIDGLAVQKIIDEQCRRHPAQATSYRAEVLLPAGNPRFTRGLITDGPIALSIRGAGDKVTEVSIETDGEDFIRHGLTYEGGGGALLISDLCVTSHGLGVAIQANFTEEVPTLRVKDSQFLGFGGGAMRIDNASFVCIEGVRFEGGDLSTDGVVVTSTRSGPLMTGSFVGFWDNVQVLKYDWGFRFVSTTNPGIEGQFFRGCQINECNHVIEVTSSASGYRVPEYVFDGCEWEVYGSHLSFKRVEQIIFTSCFGLSRGDFIYNDVAYFEDCLSVTWRDTQLKIFNSSTNMLSFKDCTSAWLGDGCQFIYQGPLSAPRIYNSISGNVDMHERGSSYPNVPPGAVKLFGILTKWESQTIAALVDGQCNPAGVYQIMGTHAGGLVSGRQTISLPTKPDGSPLFGSAPTIMVSNGDALNGPTDIVSIYQTQASQFKVQWKTVQGGNPSGPRRVNWVASGKM